MDKIFHLSSGNRRILQIAVPSIISNITVPLLGLIDVTIVGHLGSAAYIGAIAVGGMLFNIILLDIRFSADGYQWNDFSGIRQARS